MIVCTASHSTVNDAHLVACRERDVSVGQISVDYVRFVQVAESTGDLVEYLGRALGFGAQTLHEAAKFEPLVERLASKGRDVEDVCEVAYATGASETLTQSNQLNFRVWG